MDGRSVRRGRLFRSDALHELVPSDVDVLAGLGLRTVIDLRTERELERTGRGPLESSGVAVHHLAVVKEGRSGDGVADGESVGAPAPAGDDLAERYLWYLDIGRDALVGSLELLADGERYPLVFHCAAGKDRTGVLAALVLELLGVDREVIVADYVITAERLRFIMDRWLAEPEFAARMATVPASRFSVEASTMEGFLAGLDEQHGGARAWALGSGLSERSLSRIAALLLDDHG